MNTKDLTYKQIIRNINISMLANTELEEPFYSIYKELKEVFSNLNIYKSEDSLHLHLTYYGKTKEDILIIYDEKNNTKELWVNFKIIWDAFESKLSDKCMQGIVSWYVWNIFELGKCTHIRFPWKLKFDGSNNMVFDMTI